MEKSDLRQRLSDIQWKVTQENDTERPYSSPYTNLKETGNYFCIVCNTKLFTSVAKFDSHCGWPAFSAPAVHEQIKELVDTTHGMRRVEVRCKTCDAHLGHVFDDGPPPSGIRYCINGASLNFIRDN